MYLLEVWNLGKKDSCHTLIDQSVFNANDNHKKSAYSFVTFHTQTLNFGGLAFAKVYKDRLRFFGHVYKVFFKEEKSKKKKNFKLLFCSGKRQNSADYKKTVTICQNQA